MADETKLKYTVEIGKTGTGGKDAARELTELGASADRSSKLVAGFGRAFAGAFAVTQIIQFARESVRAFQEQDAASRRLDGTLAALGRSSAETSRGLKALAESVALPPGASRNSVLDAIAELVRNGATSSELPRLTQQVLDLAASGRSVESAADAMGNAVAGDFGKLSRILNVDFPAGAGRARNLADALQLVEQRFGGLAAAASSGPTAAINEFNESVTKLKAGLGEFLVTGAAPYLKGMAAAMQGVSQFFNGAPQAPYQRAPWAPGGQLGGSASGAPDLARNYDPATAQRQFADQMRALQLEMAESAIRLPQLEGAARPSPIAMAAGQRDVLAGLLDEQLKRGLIKEQEHREALKQVDQEYFMARAQMAAQAVDLEQEINSRRMDGYERESVRLQREYADAKDLIAARYQFEVEQAQAAGLNTEEILQRQEAAMQRLAEASKQAQYEASFLGSTLVRVGEDGARSFSSGLAGAMVQFASNTKNAEAAFSQFAASFMQQMAQMIMQALILRAVQGIFGAFSGGGNVSGGWGAMASGVRMAAAGAVLPRQMAVGGVQSVSSATYFPNFHAIAGEAGREVLAVLSRPRFMQIGGLASYVGSVQGNELAMTNAGDLQAAVNGRGGAVGGRIVVEVRGTRDFEARIVDSSIEGAVVRVVNELHQDGPVSSAVKGLTS